MLRGQLFMFDVKCGLSLHRWQGTEETEEEGTHSSSQEVPNRELHFVCALCRRRWWSISRSPGLSVARRSMSQWLWAWRHLVGALLYTACAPELDEPCVADIDLKRASKTFAQHFSCGSSVTGDDEVVIQGDVGTDVLDFIQERWSEVSVTSWIAPYLTLSQINGLLCLFQVDDKCIEFIGDQKRWPHNYSYYYCMAMVVTALHTMIWLLLLQKVFQRL